MGTIVFPIWFKFYLETILTVRLPFIFFLFKCFLFLFQTTLIFLTLISFLQTNLHSYLFCLSFLCRMVKTCGSASSRKRVAPASSSDASKKRKTSPAKICLHRHLLWLPLFNQTPHHLFPKPFLEECGGKPEPSNRPLLFLHQRRLRRC